MVLFHFITLMIPNYRPFRSMSKCFRDKNFCSSWPFGILFIYFYKILNFWKYFLFLVLTVIEIAFSGQGGHWFFFIKFGIFENTSYKTPITLVIPNFGPFRSISHRYRDSNFGKGVHFYFFLLNFAFLKIFVIGLL